MEKVIAGLQRERWFALQNIEHFEAQLVERKQEAVELASAIEKLGGDASPSACREANEAFQHAMSELSVTERVRGAIGSQVEQLTR